LLEKLEYNVPKNLTDLSVKEQGSGSLGSILDLGCGTGLTGVELKDFCSNLEGIDLSNRMLEQARIKNVYDKLIHVDIVEYLSNAELNFDYFISTDVFIYVGELSEVFRLIKSRNKKYGKLVFSTEHTEKDGFHIEKSGRYSHSKNYIENLCKEFNYSISHFSETNLRKEKGAFLTGGLYLLDF
jgi:predicted TPR repeat methyltransferase